MTKLSYLFVGHKKVTKKFMSFCAKVLKDQRNLAVRPGNCTAELRVAKTAKTTDALLKDKIILPHKY